MSHMLRTFHPVGQGAFYTEEFSNFTMVYVCGTVSGQDYIKQLVKTTFTKGQVIDVVFLSHLHNDHVNGLEYLLDYCNVKEVYLPYIIPRHRYFLLLHNFINGDFQLSSFPNRLIVSPEQTLSEMARVTYVLPFDIETYNQEDKMWPAKNYVNSGYEKKYKDWVFIPYNYDYSKRALQFEKALNNEGIHISPFDDFMEVWQRSNKYKLIKAYNAVKGDLNTNSLVVYSGPQSDFHNYLMGSTSFSGLYCLNNCSPMVGCLYLGDYDASGKRKWTKLRENFSNYYDHVGTIQIPHHGSAHSYNDLINNRPGLISVISAGLTNSYSHPHGSVIKTILRNHGHLHLINELPGSARRYLITKYYSL